LLTAGLLLWSADRARSQEDGVRAVIEKAIQAQGGLKKLDRDLASHRRSKGTFYTDGYTFTSESFSEPGGRRRIALRGTLKDRPHTRMLILDGDKGWRNDDGAIYEVWPAYLDSIKKSMYADRVCGLVTLVKDKGYTLTLLGESQVKDALALGVRVQSEGKPDVFLYFDKATHLLIKSANKVMDLQTQHEVFQEVYYYDYRLYDPAEADEAALRAGKHGVDGPALLALLRKGIPDEAEQVKMKDLILKLGHKSFSVRQRATAALQEFGAKAAPLLRVARRDPDREVARRAEQCLEKLGQTSDQVLAASAVRLIALRRPAGAAEALLAYVPWAPDETVAREVQGALAALAAEPEQNSALVLALKDRDPQRRATAEAALGRDGGFYLKQGWRRVIVDGVRMSMRCALYRDGQHFMDIETLGVEYFNRLDDSLFARP
jgi:hypothetical protein